MPLALDASTPAIVNHNDGTPTTASFTAPANSFLVATFAYESTGGTPIINDTGGLTWTARGTNQDRVRIWTAKPATAVSRTVHAEDGNSGFGGPGNIKVSVWTGQHATTPVGNSGSAAGNTTNDATVTGYTSSVDNSWGVFICHTSTNNGGAPVSTDTEDAFTFLSGQAGMHIRKAAATTPASTVVQFNMDAAGTGAASWNWIALELLEAAAPVVYQHRLMQDGTTKYTQTPDVRNAQSAV